ncbi:MAG: hypothetical protein OEQ18_14410 [Gammaproteobacteria bacterium]|nr:hypothetical protein [Gammaproteobacteria bacterium]
MKRLLVTLLLFWPVSLMADYEAGINAFMRSAPPGRAGLQQMDVTHACLHRFEQTENQYVTNH